MLTNSTDLNTVQESRFEMYMIESRLICLWVGTHNQSESGSKTDAAVITRSALSPTLKHREREMRGGGRKRKKRRKMIRITQSIRYSGRLDKADFV